MKKLIFVAALAAGSAQAQYQGYYAPDNRPQGYSQQMNSNTSAYYDNTGRLGSSYSYGGQTVYVDQYNRPATPQQMYQQPNQNDYNPGTAINNRYQGYSR